MQKPNKKNLQHIIAIGAASALLMCPTNDSGAAKAAGFGRPKQPTIDEYVHLS
jgi:hypothetical protein